MGWNEGILVVKQITDEKKWFRAMEDIRREFQGEDYFKEYPVEAIKELSSGYPYSVMKGAFEETDNVRAWEIVEPINFCEEGMGFQWHWKYFGNCLIGEALDKNAIKEELEAEKNELNKKLADAYDGEGMDLYYQAQIKGVQVALEHLESLSPEDFEVLSKSPHVSPPDLFEFCIGEHPRLPVFGRHFKHCASKILGRSDEVIKSIYAILHRHFPEHVVHWSEIKAENPEIFGMEYAYQPGRKYFKSAPRGAEGRAQFYRKLEDQFDNFKRAGTAQEFRMARKTFAGIQ